MSSLKTEPLKTENSDEAIITLWAAARRIDPARPADCRALEQLCRRADPPIWVALDDDGIRCCRSEDLPRIAAELKTWLGRPRIWPRKLGKMVVVVAEPSPFTARCSPWRAAPAPET